MEFRTGDVLALPLSTAFRKAPVSAVPMSTVGFGTAWLTFLPFSGRRVPSRKPRASAELRTARVQQFYLWFDHAYPGWASSPPGRVAYRYLPASVKRFPAMKKALMEQAGLEACATSFWRGIIALHPLV